MKEIIKDEKYWNGVLQMRYAADNMGTKDPKVELDYIKIQLKTGAIDYDEARDLAKPYLEDLNNRMKKIAKKFGKTHYNVSFVGYMR